MKDNKNKSVSHRLEWTQKIHRLSKEKAVSQVFQTRHRSVEIENRSRPAV